MPKPAAAERSYSRYARDAAALLGELIRDARTGRGLTVAEVAERAGVSRGLVHRIEKGDMGCSIGAAFEVAAIVGVPLFEAEPTALSRRLAGVREKTALLPKSVRRSRTAIDDDF